MTLPSEEVVFRLLLAKSLLNRVRTHPVAQPDDSFVAQQVLTAHDAAELAIAGVADHWQAHPSQSQQYLMQYIATLEQKLSKSVEGKAFMGQLNQARVGLKHYGNRPDAQQWIRVADKTYDIVAKWCDDFLGISFQQLDRSSLLQLTQVRELYNKAKEQTENEDYKEALVTLAKALHILFQENSALRGFGAGVARSEDAIKLSGFGVHGNDYLALQEFLPRISTSDGELQPVWEQTRFGHPGNWRHDTAEFCLNVFLDMALKVQGANWIPGALDFQHLYTYQITALEAVNVTKERPTEGEAPESLFVLQAEESLTVTDVVQLDARPDLVDIVFQHQFPNTPKKIMPECLRVHFEADHQYYVGFINPTKVQVMCIPLEEPFRKQYFPELPSVPWQVRREREKR
jgi:hypothetical protein